MKQNIKKDEKKDYLCCPDPKCTDPECCERGMRPFFTRGILVIFVILIIGVLIFQFFLPSMPKDYSVATPEEVVREYFQSWDKKDWPGMYATISDGFKRIDPNAKDLNTFGNFASAQGIENVEIISIQQESNDGTTAVAAYTVEFTLSNGAKQLFSDKFSLKYRINDRNPGWKLVHPYGPNIDTS